MRHIRLETLGCLTQMTKRSSELQWFLAAAEAAYAHLVTEPAARKAIGIIFDALQTPAAVYNRSGSSLPTCEFLDTALMQASTLPTAAVLARRFRNLEPQLNWRRRTNSNASASANFPQNHAEALICGPGGVEDRSDVWLGMSVLAPNVRYPDHQHAPEEVYLFLSAGEFLQGDSGWFTAGVGGIAYNPLNTIRAVQSRDQPLLVLWASNTRP